MAAEDDVAGAALHTLVLGFFRGEFVEVGLEDEDAVEFDGDHGAVDGDFLPSPLFQLIRFIKKNNLAAQYLFYRDG